MPTPPVHQAAHILLALSLAFVHAYAGIPPDAGSLVKRMEAAYAGIRDYRTQVEVKTYGESGSFETKKFLYTFKKPKWIRLDFESPYSGMIVVYPDEAGKAVVQLPGLARFLRLRLATDSLLLRESSGQRLDQTDMGLLIGNISRSLSDQRRGALKMAEENGRLLVQAAATDHFRRGVVTLYQFFIDKKTWLPVEVKESTFEGRPVRTVTFGSLKTNTGVPDAFFRLD